MINDSLKKLLNSADYFDNIRILEIIDYYDGPKIFTFLTQSNDYFLAYFCDNSEECIWWLYVPINKYLLKKIKENKITIKSFFELSHVSYLVKKKYDGTIVETKEYLYDEIMQSDELMDYIPNDDVYLDKLEEGIIIKTVNLNALS